MRLQLFTGVAIGAICIAQAHGQSLDYVGLESLYGEPVTLSATGSPLRASEAPANLTIITADDIRRSGAVDIPEVLDRFAGVSVWRSAAGAPEVSIRGYNAGFSRQLLVLLNGREMFNSFYPNVQWGALPVALDEIRQIELVKGTASALYGFNAAAGVINIVTKRPLSETGGAVDLRAGNGGYLQGSAHVVEKVSSKVGVSISGQARRQDAFDTLGVFDPGGRDAAIGVVEQDDDGGFAAIRVEAMPQSDIILDGELTFSRTTQNNYYALQTLAGVDFTSVDGTAGLSWDLGGVVLSGRAHYRRTDAEHVIIDPVGAFGAGGDIFANLVFDRFPFENDYFSLKGESLFRVPGGDSSRVAIEYRRSELPTIPLATDEVAFDNIAAAASYDLRRFKRFDANLALRADIGLVRRDNAPLDPNDDGERTFFRPSANVGLVGRPTDDDTLRLLLGYGHILPSVAEFGGFESRAQGTFSAGVSASGSSDLDPTRVFNAELGYERRLPMWKGVLAATVFYKHYEDLIDIAPSEFVGLIGTVATPDTPTSPLVIWRNAGDSEAFGGDLSLSFEFGTAWRLEMNYAYIDISDDLSGPVLPNPQTGEVARLPRTVVDPATGVERPTFSTAFFEDGTPEHTANAALFYERDRWSLTLNGAYYDDYRLLRTIEIGESVFISVDERFELGGRLGYAFPFGLDASIQVNNVVDNRYREGALKEAEQRWFASLAYRW